MISTSLVATQWWQGAAMVVVVVMMMIATSPSMASVHIIPDDNRVLRVRASESIEESKCC